MPDGALGVATGREVPVAVATGVAATVAGVEALGTAVATTAGGVTVIPGVAVRVAARVVAGAGVAGAAAGAPQAARRVTTSTRATTAATCRPILPRFSISLLAARSALTNHGRYGARWERNCRLRPANGVRRMLPFGIDRIIEHMVLDTLPAALVSTGRFMPA